MINFFAALSSFWTAWCFVSLTAGGANSYAASSPEFIAVSDPGKNRPTTEVSYFAWMALRHSLSIPLALALAGFFFFLPRSLPLSQDASNALELIVAFTTTVLWLRRRTDNIIGAKNGLKAPIEYSIGGKTAAQNTKTRSFSPKILALCFLSLWSWSVALLYAFRTPQGLLDSWPIWNLHARFLFYGGDSWNVYLNPVLSWTHPDYPLLLPLAVARGWSVFGRETAAVPILISVAFGTATASLLASSLITLRHSFLSGFAALATLIGTPLFLLYSTAQCADIPLGFFMLATLVCVTLGLEDIPEARRAGCFVLAGTMASLAAWTKNEGLLFFVILLAAQLFCGIQGHKRQLLRQIAFFVLGALPFLLLCAWFKHSFAPPNDLISGQDVDMLSKIIDMARLREIVWAFVITGGSFGEWIIPPAFLLGVYAWVMKTEQPQPRPNKALLLVFLVLALVAAGYFLVYMTTPRNLSWHLRTSLGRLMLQMWPTFLFGFFLALRAPEDAAQPQSSTRSFRPDAPTSR